MRVDPQWLAQCWASTPARVVVLIAFGMSTGSCQRNRTTAVGWQKDRVARDFYAYGLSCGKRDGDMGTAFYDSMATMSEHSFPSASPEGLKNRGTLVGRTVLYLSTMGAAGS